MCLGGYRSTYCTSWLQYGYIGVRIRSDSILVQLQVYQPCYYNTEHLSHYPGQFYLNHTARKVHSSQRVQVVHWGWFPLPIISCVYRRPNGDMSHAYKIMGELASPTSYATAMQSYSATILFWPNQKLQPSHKGDDWCVGVDRGPHFFPHGWWCSFIYMIQIWWSSWLIISPISHASEPKSHSAKTLVFYTIRKVYPSHKRWYTSLAYKTLGDMASPTYYATEMQNYSATILVFWPNQKVHSSYRGWMVWWGRKRSTFCVSWVVLSMYMYIQIW